VSREENLAMIADSVAFLRGEGKRVIYDAEHFFDGYRDDPGYALECLRAAAEAGAENVTLCDTNGQPSASSAKLAAVVEAVGKSDHTYATRRCGGQLPPPLRRAPLVRGRQWDGEALRRQTTSICRSSEDGLPASSTTGWRPAPPRLLTGSGMRRPDQACVGATPSPTGRRRGWACGQTPAPLSTSTAAVGNGRDITPLRLSGRERTWRLGPTSVDEQGAAGHRPEGREPWLSLQAGDIIRLLRREAGGDRCSVGDFRITEKREDGKVQTEATIKVWVEGDRYVRTAEGNGPVNALDTALRGAIIDRHPHLADIELTNYKVRILDEHHGTGAVTRVLLDSSDGEREWGSIGVSENIIEASWEALVDSLEYAFQPHADARAAGESERSRTTR
jgi:2-isopropylmalate synthase